MIREGPGMAEVNKKEKNKNEEKDGQKSKI
jgi:hypothetical protein